MQIWIEFPGDRVDRLQSILSQEIVELFENQTHARIDGRAFAFAARGGKAKLKIIDNADQFNDNGPLATFRYNLEGL